MPIMNKSSSQKEHLFFLLLLVWFFLNLGQAALTGIHYDEVYYAIWGRQLDWGYFDHPPAVAMLTHLGALFFEGNLSVRFFTIVLQLITALMVWHSIDEQYRKSGQAVWLFFIIIASFPFFSVYSFTTTPDTPLMFFAAMFLWSYKRFLGERSWIMTLFMSVAMAGMLYSKYHGVLLIGFIVLSNMRLLLDVRFWVAGLLALGLLAPHILWHIEHDFVSFKFHLIGRSDGFTWDALSFFPEQFAIFNPFTFVIILFILWKYKPKGAYERGLYFLIIGVIGFFTLSTIRGKAEAHWASVVSIPMMILLFEKTMQEERIKNYVQKYIKFSLILILIARVLLLTDIAQKLGYADREKIYREMEKIAGNSPVVFNNSFQDASLYQYYTGKPSTTISAIENRQTQYDIWQKEQGMQGKKVFVILETGAFNINAEHRFQRLKIGEFPFEGFFVEDFQVPNRLKIHYQLTQTKFRAGQEVVMPIEIENPTAHEIDFQHKDFPITPRVVFMVWKRNYILQDASFSTPLKTLKPNEKIKGILKFKMPEIAPRGYRFSVVLGSFWGHALNSPFEQVEIK